MALSWLIRLGFATVTSPSNSTFFHSKAKKKAAKYLTSEQAILKAIQSYFCGHASPTILAQLCNP